MITLGCFDSDVSAAACAAYKDEVGRVTRLPLSGVADGVDKIALRKYVPDTPGGMSVADVQRGLVAAGFFPGGTVDGICGYRTLSAMRLFQEYVRCVEKLDCLPDGRFGPKSQQHLQRWLDKHLMPNWSAAIANWKSHATGNTEYNAWLELLGKVKERYTSSPNRMLQMVNAFARPSDTRKVERWDFASPDSIHLIGVRRESFSGKFDDVFVLLIKGLVFKFQGSTEPGASGSSLGPPFLVHGQHEYHFGWHKSTYLALRPQSTGVLVVRSKKDMRLDESDLANGLEPNATINIHWGGKGMNADVKNWSEGCQVINGSLYMNADGDLIDCSGFAALNQAELASNPQKTRGAYNVALDLVTALSGDMPSNAVKYTLLAEDDLSLAPALAAQLKNVSDQVARKLECEKT